jgi:uncharacterized protein (UPF0335 family)
MGRKKSDEAVRMPTELGALRKLVGEFMERFENVDHELDMLKEDQKLLIEEFSDRLDMKTLKQAMRTVKIRKKVNHLDTYESFLHILDERTNL